MTSHARQWRESGPESRLTRARPSGRSRCSTPTGSGTRHEPVAAPLSAPVELGLGVHRDRATPATNQDRAETELRSLFAGQWSDGLLPHIVFATATAATSRARTSGRPSARRTRPARPQTSGIVQPPIHATAAWQRLPPCGRDREQARGFLDELCRASRPGTSTSTASARAATTASSRSGTRGSRAWTTRRSGTRRSRGSRPRRRASRPTSASTSTSPTPRSGRPTPSTTATSYLVGLFRELDYDPRGSARRRRSRCSPCCSTRCSSRRDRDLAEIARVARRRSRAVREPGRAHRRGHRRRALGRRAGGLRRLRRARRRARAGAQRRRARAALRGHPDRRAGARAWSSAWPARASRSTRTGWAVTSLAPDDPASSPTLYWRGPVWPILNWVLQRGLAATATATRARRRSGGR